MFLPAIELSQLLCCGRRLFVDTLDADIGVGSYVETADQRLYRIAAIRKMDECVARELYKFDRMAETLAVASPGAAAWHGRQVSWTNVQQPLKIDDLRRTVSVFPVDMVRPYDQEYTGAYVACGGILVDSEGETAAVTDAVRFAANDVNDTPVSSLHFLPPELTADPRVSLRAAFDDLLVSVARARGGQVDKLKRQMPAIGSFAEAFAAAAKAEEHAGIIFEAAGNRLKMWFESAGELQAALGEVQFKATYGLGTPFILNPPFGILYQPRTGKCWVRCAPETIERPDGTTITSVPKKRERKKESDGEDGECQVEGSEGAAADGGGEDDGMVELPVYEPPSLR